MSSLFIQRPGVYIFEPFLQHGVLAAFTTRRWNFLSTSANRTSEEKDWNEFCQMVDVPVERIAHFKQVHGDGIASVGKDFRAPGFPRMDCVRDEADAATTKEINSPLVVFTADCAPVFVVDPKNRAVALVHSGWRGTEKGLSGKVVSKMCSDFGSKPKDLLIGFGPMIRECCYEVGREFMSRFPHEVNQRDSRCYFDLKNAIQKDLIELGVEKYNIWDSGFCTACRVEEFFSYRQEGSGTGRLCSVVMIRSAGSRD